MCGKILVFVFSISFFINAGFAQSHGLQFSSHEVVQEKRTSLNLTPSKAYCLRGEAEISFDLMFRPNLEIYFGYIIRIITSNHENIDLVYNQRLRNFNFVIGEAFSGVFEIDSARLFGNWNRLAIRIDESKQEVALYLNNRLIGRGKSRITKETCFNVSFGATEFEGFRTVDIPPMNIRDIRIREEANVVAFLPLNETDGNLAKDVAANQTVPVKNAVWVKPKHQNWESVSSFATRGFPSVAFDPAREILYVVSQDSLYQYSLKTRQLTLLRLSKSRELLPAGNQSIFLPATNTLYNFYIDQRQVSVYDPENRQWNVNFTEGPLTVYWHANKFFSAFDTSLYVIGGYGQLEYKNTVQRFHLPTARWEIIQPRGDAFMPRYLAALGTNAARDTAFILGGYGSATGDQAINPKYNYELMAFSVKERSFHRVYQLKEPKKPFCFANSLVIDSNRNDFFALTYPNDRFNSSLQLIRGSLRTASYQLMGSPIPYLFYDIRSFADLYFCPGSKKLLAVTMYTDKNDITQVRVYTIDFPPNELVTTPPAGKNDIVPSVFGGFLILFLLVGFVYFRYYKTRRKPGTGRVAPIPPKTTDQVKVPTVPAPEQVADLPPDTRPVSSVFLFGQLEIFDKEGLDITSRFTPLLRELFLLILIHTFRDGKGISSEQLYNILWRDKPLKDARNNFSVNIVKLKQILQKLGDCHVSRESGKWKIEIENRSIQVDYHRYVSLTSGNRVPDKPYVLDLIAVIGRGPFLPGVHYSWLDDIKSQVASRVIDLLLPFLSGLDLANEAELVVRVANCIFFFDLLNEEALAYKCRALTILGRHGIARETYLKFKKEYAENYAQEFPKSFAEVTAQP